MKKISAISAAVMCALLFVTACAQKTEPKGGNLTSMKTVEEIVASAGEGALNGEQTVEKFTTPFYETQIQYDEGFFLLENADGSIGDVRLLFPIAKLLEVRSNDLTKVYRDGEDYVVTEDGKLRITENSGIKAMKRTDFFLPDDVAADFLYNSNAGDDAGKKPTTDKDALYPYRYVATYIRDEVYDGFVPENKSAKVKKLTDKIGRGEKLNLLYFGDSIGTGAGASGSFDKLADLLSSGMASRASVRTLMRNASVGGINSSDAKLIVEGNLASIRPDFRNSAIAAYNLIEKYAASTDVAFIAFGANDCAGNVPSATFEANICAVADYFRDKNPDVTIVFVTSMNISPKVKKSAEKGGANLNIYDIERYADVLDGLETEYENSLNADIFRLQRSLLSVKKWEDLIADNLNHPCDYMQRIYVQGIIATMGI